MAPDVSLGAAPGAFGVSEPRQDAEAGTGRGAPEARVKVGWRKLIPLGISGGALPCPTAVVVLMMAIHHERVALGLALILSFSVGLAAVLTAIGILMVTGSSVLTRFSGGGRLVRVMPAVSALIVTGIGFALLYNTWQARDYYRAQMVQSPANTSANPPANSPK